MNDELKPVKCGCGGEAEIFHIAPEGYKGSYCVRCVNCLTQSPFFTGNKEKAIEVWNTAMGARYVTDEVFDKIKDEVVEDVLKSVKIERTAKVKVLYKDESVIFGHCECGQAVNTYSTYCLSCGARLEWE